MTKYLVPLFLFAAACGEPPPPISSLSQALTSPTWIGGSQHSSGGVYSDPIQAATFPVAVGDAVLVHAEIGSGGVTINGVSDGLGNVYTPIAAHSTGSARAFVGLVTHAGSANIAVDLSSQSYWNIVRVGRWSGVGSVAGTSVHEHTQWAYCYGDDFVYTLTTPGAALLVTMGNNASTPATFTGRGQNFSDKVVGDGSQAVSFSMPNYGAKLGVLLAFVGGGDPPDASNPPQDLAVAPVDTAVSPDLTTPPAQDQAVTTDLAVVDLTAPPVVDLVTVVDLTTLPDLTPVVDLTTPPPPVGPTLGAHMVFARDEQCGTNPALSNSGNNCGTGPFGTLNTQNGSLMLALAMGWTDNDAAPSDSRGNTYARQDGNHSYYCAGCDGVFDTSLFASRNILGGAGHFWSFPEPVRPNGEITVPLIEVRGATEIREVKYTYSVGTGFPWVEGTGAVTCTKDCLLVAIWGGGANGLNHNVVANNGFAIIDSYLNIGPTSAVQVAVAVKNVPAGTHSMTWASNTDSDAACYLIAVQ